MILKMLYWNLKKKTICSDLEMNPITEDATNQIINKIFAKPIVKYDADWTKEDDIICNELLTQHKLKLRSSSIDMTCINFMLYKCKYNGGKQCNISNSVKSKSKTEIIKKANKEGLSISKYVRTKIIENPKEW